MRELARFGEAGTLGDVVAAWPEAVGDAIAANAWPARVGRDGTLHVHASSSTWAFELAQLEPTLRARLRGLLGDTAPARLRFAVGNVPAPAAPTTTDPTPAPTLSPSEEDLEQAAGIAAGIEDEGLRKSVQRAAAALLARTRSDRPF